jgi:putative addiction module component (TIGR02574 family)
VTAEAERVLEAALDLPDAERAELAAILTDSIGDGAPDVEIEAAWIAEAKRRLADIRSGKSETVAWEDVERELDEIIESPDVPERIAR